MACGLHELRAFCAPLEVKGKGQILASQTSHGPEGCSSVTNLHVLAQCSADAGYAEDSCSACVSSSSQAPRRTGLCRRRMCALPLVFYLCIANSACRSMPQPLATLDKGAPSLACRALTCESQLCLQRCLALQGLGGHGAARGGGPAPHGGGGR
jgi:hypothetical protein